MIQASFIIEMMGKPPEHIKKTLKEYIDKIGEENVRVVNKSIAKPKKLENDLFSTFAEIEVETEDLIEILRIIFTYMPSHVEIIRPESIILKNADFNSMANELLMRLHKYDEIAKTISMEKAILENQLKQLNIQPITEKLQEQQIQKQTQSIKNKTKSKKNKAKKK